MDLMMGASNISRVCSVPCTVRAVSVKGRLNQRRSVTVSCTTSDSQPKKKVAGILRPVPVSVEMKNFLGVSESSRTNAIKKIWEYIKAHNLQDPANKKEIICDENLKSIFRGKDRVGFLEISGLMNDHFMKKSST